MKRNSIPYRKYVALQRLKIVRRTLAKAQGWRCFYCTGRIDSFTATFDHIILASEGGCVSVDNGVVACERCNWLRGDMPFEQFAADMGIRTKKPGWKTRRFRLLCELVDG